MREQKEYLKKIIKKLAMITSVVFCISQCYRYSFNYHFLIIAENNVLEFVKCSRFYGDKI